MTAFRSRNASKSAAQDFQPKSSQSGVVFRPAGPAQSNFDDSGVWGFIRLGDLAVV